MPCPLLKDDIRECKSKFQQLIKEVPFECCNSEEYTICPFYQILIENKPYCEHIEECSSGFHSINSIIEHNMETYKKIMHLVFDHCLSNNKLNCARYELMTKEEEIPNDFLQDGSRLKAKELLKDNTYY